jgi:hypothetical protein
MALKIYKTKFKYLGITFIFKSIVQNPAKVDLQEFCRKQATEVFKINSNSYVVSFIEPSRLKALPDLDTSLCLMSIDSNLTSEYLCRKKISLNDGSEKHEIDQLYMDLGRLIIQYNNRPVLNKCLILLELAFEKDKIKTAVKKKMNKSFLLDKKINK